MKPVQKLWVQFAVLPALRFLRDTCNPMAPFYPKLVLKVNDYERWIR